ncbi:MAG: SgcJ/EcaC family oxidoreductase [Gammaproteobacteria bacterium]
MRILTLLPLACGLLVSTAQAATAPCHPASEKDIAALFDRWNASLQTGSPTKVVANYASKSVLLPTLSNKPRLTADEKADYFVHFLEGKPSGKIDSRTIEIDCNSAVDAGLYTFKFADGRQVKARYTFTYKWDQDQWRITSHHSSAMPEPVLN